MPEEIKKTAFVFATKIRHKCDEQDVRTESKEDATVKFYNFQKTRHHATRVSATPDTCEMLVDLHDCWMNFTVCCRSVLARHRIDAARLALSYEDCRGEIILVPANLATSGKAFAAHDRACPARALQTGTGNHF